MEAAYICPDAAYGTHKLVTSGLAMIDSTVNHKFCEDSVERESSITNER